MSYTRNHAISRIFRILGHVRADKIELVGAGQVPEKLTECAERLGIAPHVVEAVVNHVSGPAKRGVAGVYNRAIYLEDRRRALEAWADFIVSDANSPERSFSLRSFRSGALCGPKAQVRFAPIPLKNSLAVGNAQDRFRTGG